MSIFEVTAAGFNSTTDATDDRVIWVTAKDQSVVLDAIHGTEAEFHGELPPDAAIDVDFELMDGSDLRDFRAVLMWFRAHRSTYSSKE